VVSFSMSRVVNRFGQHFSRVRFASHLICRLNWEDAMCRVNKY